MFRQLLTLLVVLFFVQTLVSANHDSNNKVATQQANHEEISNDVDNFDVAEEDDVDEEDDLDEEEQEQQEEEEEEEEDEDFDEEFDEEFDEDEEAAQDDEDLSEDEDEENYADVINRNLASLEELKKALDPLPKKKEELIEGINRNLAKLAATITASNYPTLNPIPTAPSKSRTPSFQPGATPSNTPTHQVAVTPSQTQTRATAVTPSGTGSSFIASASGTPLTASATPLTASGTPLTASGTISTSRSRATAVSISASRVSNSPEPCRQLSTKRCNQNAACYYSVLFNRCERKGTILGGSATRSRAVNPSSSATAGTSKTRTVRTITRNRSGCFSLKTQAVCNSVNACVWVPSKSKCAHR